MGAQHKYWDTSAPWDDRNNYEVVLIPNAGSAELGFSDCKPLALVCKGEEEPLEYFFFSSKASLIMDDPSWYEKNGKKFVRYNFQLTLTS